MVHEFITELEELPNTQWKRPSASTAASMLAVSILAVS